jgi:hypothetical protein
VRLRRKVDGEEKCQQTIAERSGDRPRADGYGVPGSTCNICRCDPACLRQHVGAVWLRLQPVQRDVQSARSLLHEFGELSGRDGAKKRQRPRQRRNAEQHNQHEPGHNANSQPLPQQFGRAAQSDYRPTRHFALHDPIRIFMRRAGGRVP